MRQMQSINLTLNGKKRKLVLVAKPWAKLGDHVRIAGELWEVVGTQTTCGVLIPKGRQLIACARQPEAKQVRHEQADDTEQVASGGASRFGPDPQNWQFVCPVCGHVAAVRDWENAGAPLGSTGFSCIGRWTQAGPHTRGQPGPCN